MPLETNDSSSARSSLERSTTCFFRVIGVLVVDAVLMSFKEISVQSMADETLVSQRFMRKPLSPALLD